MKMPTLFISHGAPDMVLHETPSHLFLKGLPKLLPEAPQAILVVSAHWETAEPRVTGSAAPKTIHDFQGFPDEMYKLVYPAPGSPALAAKAADILGATVDAERGLDHGAWSPLMIAFPEARIPVVQLSIQPDKDAAWHYASGQKLAPLREEGVLIMATGNTTHNLRAAFRGHYTSVPAEVREFSAWLYKMLSDKDHQQLQDWETAAPHARWNHPTPDHLLPLFVALGAAGPDAPARRIHDSVDFNVLAMDSYMFG